MITLADKCVLNVTDKTEKRTCKIKTTSTTTLELTITRKPKARSHSGSRNLKCRSSSKDSLISSSATIEKWARTASKSPFTKTGLKKCVNTISNHSRLTSEILQPKLQPLVSGLLKNPPLSSQCSTWWLSIWSQRCIQITPVLTARFLLESITYQSKIS